MYYGESQTSVDDKGRITVPVQFRSVMDVHDHDVWYMTRGFDGAIFVFHKEQWEALLKERGMFSTLDPRMLDFRRLFLGSVAKVKRDRQGRLAVPAHLREYAGIDQKAVLLGVEDHLELWSKEGWRSFQERQAREYKAMAAELFGPRESTVAANEGAVQGNEN
jgi:MraZ protein